MREEWPGYEATVGVARVRGYSACERSGPGTRLQCISLNEYNIESCSQALPTHTAGDEKLRNMANTS